MYDVITFGSAMLDSFVYTGLREEKRKIAYPVGTKIPIKELRLSFGGSGANLAVALARLGLRTAYLGKLGVDDIADKILKNFKDNKVAFIGKRAKGYTGFGVVLDSYERHRTILVYHGVGDELRFNEVNKAKLKTKWMYFTSLKGESFKTEEKLIPWLKKKGIKIAYNMDEYLAKQGTAKLKKILKSLDLMIMNKEEAQALVKKKKMGDLLRAVHKAGPRIVVITDGMNPVHAYDGVHICSIKPHKGEVVEKTGAGDAFGAGFLAGLIKTLDIDFALKLGLENSESVIKYYGAQNKLLTWKEAVKNIR